jgi:type I restriction enzyme, R subunit
MLEKYEICLGLFHGFDLSPLTQRTAQQRISMIPAGQECILAQERGKKRLLQALKELSEAFALAVSHD